VVNAFLKFNDIKRHYTFILYWLGFNVGYIEYIHSERHSGKSSYNLSALLKLALGGVLFQTTTLLKWIMYLGFFLSLAGIGLAFYYVMHYFFYSVSPGWTTIIVMLLVIGGIIISSIGVVGLYIAGIFEQTKGRPLFVIDEKVGS
jgi:dolichol-phosphate mannosyltransferase